MRPAARHLIPAVLLSWLSACGSSTVGPIPPPSYSPSPSVLSAGALKLVQSTPGAEAYVADPVVVKILLDFERGGLTPEQYVADKLTKYSVISVTAIQVSNYRNAGCLPGANSNDTANRLDNLIPQADATAVAAVKSAVDLLVICKTDVGNKIKPQNLAYINAVADATSAFVLTRHPGAVPLPAPTSAPAPTSGGRADLYHAICAAGSTAVSLSAWHEQIKHSRGGLLGLTIVSFGLAYCPTLMTGFFGN
jgi:hypothetical protein